MEVTHRTHPTLALLLLPRSYTIASPSQTSRSSGPAKSAESNPTVSTNTQSVVVQDLNFSYFSESEVLSSVSFRLEPGVRTGLVGPSGAGKSTLLMHLNGLLPTIPPGQESACVKVGDLPVTAASLPQIRRRVGLVFQDPDDQLFCPLVRDDVAFGPRNLGLSHEQVDQRVEESLASVGLLPLIDRSTLNLSYGERKRICLAGVLACQPSILLLDEPAANLDPRNRRRLIEILAEFTGTILLATHDLELVLEVCDQVMVLDDGRIQHSGSVRTILSDGPSMKRHGLEVPLSLRCQCPD